MSRPNLRKLDALAAIAALAGGLAARPAEAQGAGPGRHRANSSSAAE